MPKSDSSSLAQKIGRLLVEGSRAEYATDFEKQSEIRGREIDGVTAPALSDFGWQIPSSFTKLYILDIFFFIDFYPLHFSWK